jgi:thioredoxin reductase (NADPH)
VSQPGQVHRISPVSFRRLMDEDPDLSDVILRALMARRRYLRAAEAAWSIEILGSEMSAGALALRTYTARQQLPHTWVEIDTPAGAALARAVAAACGDLPVVITPTAVLRHATPALLTGQLGLSYQPVAGPLLDLVIVGAGPAGLAAAVYDASEGLKTLLLDAAAAGGQAAASSRIENHLGFTSGISGAELTGRRSAGTEIRRPHRQPQPGCPAGHHPRASDRAQARGRHARHLPGQLRPSTWKPTCGGSA